MFTLLAWFVLLVYQLAPTNGLTCNCVEIGCITRSAQGEAWVTARGDEFLDPTVLSTHFIADIINDNEKIYKYKIQWSGGSWSGWYFPGENDNEWTAKSNSDNVWNQAHKDAGRRAWTLFGDHFHEVCYLKNETIVTSPTGTCDCGEGVEVSCITRSSQGESWVTARGDAFLDPVVLSKHFIADIINDNMKIYNYKIQWSGGSWSGWYFPGVNDNEWGAKSNDDVWNQAHKDAGRRSWTLFGDHSHEVCYLMDDTPDTTSEDCTPSGICECTGIYAPICCGGETYDNECVATCQCEDLSSCEDGECSDSNYSNPNKANHYKILVGAFLITILIVFCL